MGDLDLVGAAVNLQHLGIAAELLDLGVVPEAASSYLLPAVVGWQRAAELLFTADWIDARRAVELGLASRLCGPAELLPEMRALGARIAAQPPHSLRLSKKLLRESMNLSLANSLEMAAGMQALVQHTADQQEAVTAFFEKRPPRFRGA